MRCSRSRTLLFAVALLWHGCSETEEEEVLDPVQLVLEDANNYAFSGSLDITAYEVAELTDIVLDWSLLTQDLQTNPLDPETDINTSAITVFRYESNEEVEDGLDADNNPGHSALYVFTDVTGRTSVNLAEHTLFGTDVDVETYFELAYGETWMHTLTTGDTPGVGTRMAAFLTPSPDSEVTEVTLTNDSTVIELDVDMASLTRPQVPAGRDIEVDWSGLAIDSQGNPFYPEDIDQVMVGVFASLSASDLQDHLLDLETVHDGMWYLELTDGAISADLGQLTDADGEAFPGVSTTGTWIFALHCTDCPNPAPPFLTVLDPR